MGQSILARLSRVETRVVELDGLSQLIFISL